MAIDVVSIGSAVLDILLKSDAFTVTPVNEQLMMCELYGGKMNVDDAVMVSGGAATNTAVSFARQGLHAACIAEMGKDVAAQIIWDELKREKVDTSLLIEEAEERTGISTVLVAKDGARSAMTFRGASYQLTREDIPFNELTSVKAIHLSGIGNADLVIEIGQFCREHNIFLSWNPSKTEAEELFLRRRDVVAPNVLFLNDTEWESVKEAQERIQKSSEFLIITKGKAGGIVYHNEESVRYEAKSVAHVVDETGAGDAFASGFVGAHIRGKTLNECILFGVENAASVVGYMGAKQGLLT